MVIQVNFRVKPVVESKQVQIQCSKEELMSKFKRHDVDGDGKLSKNEVKKVFKDLGSSSGFYRTYKAMHRADADRNGYISIKDDGKELEQLVEYAYECGYKVQPKH